MQVIFVILIGIVILFLFKDKIGNADSSMLKKKDDELSILYAENEKLRKRNKEAERQVEDLLSELQKLRKKAKDDSDNMDDMEDLADKYKRETKKLYLQNEDLTRQLKEYKTACETLQEELNNLKNN